MRYDYHESYKHKAAKELLHSWLVNIENGTGFQPSVPFTWRMNYGVHLELPFYETDDPYYFETSGWVENDKNKAFYPEEYDPHFDRGALLFVPDITIFHKGSATILIEVVHTCPLSRDKIKKILKFFDGYYVDLYEIDADNILSQTNKKCELKFRKISKWMYEEPPKIEVKRERNASLPTLEELRRKMKNEIDQKDN